MVGNQEMMIAQEREVVDIPVRNELTGSGFGGEFLEVIAIEPVEAIFGSNPQKAGGILFNGGYQIGR